MALLPIPIHRTQISLPEYYLKKDSVGGNIICRMGSSAIIVDADIFMSEEKGWYILKTTSTSPYSELYLRISGHKNINSCNIPVLESPSTVSSYSNINVSTKLKWLFHPSVESRDMPSESIVEKWDGAFSFRKENRENGLPGLRLPQLGALHAISAYFSVEQNIEPATVVLPTGTGKTDTMIAAAVYECFPKVLVLVPSNTLRDQLFNKFKTLGCLNELGAIPFGTPYPNVCKLSVGLQSAGFAHEIVNYSNVIIATPNILNSSSPECTNIICSSVSVLMIDEAHHVAARMWSNIRDLFKGKPIIQFTATPFRMDRGNLGGKIIFNYTMGEAQREGYFKPINFLPVEEYSLESSDNSIAREAIKQLERDLKEGKDHIIMARAAKKERATDIFKIYESIAAEFNPVLIHSDISLSNQRNILESLRRRESRVVVCVNMLGEGFDFPNLKIAAIHDIHKSLAVTLQFVGRFTRDSANIGDASIVVNIADPDVETSLQNLYAEDSDWNGILRRLSESSITREIRLQEVVEGLNRQGSLGQQISLWNLRPGFSTILFKTSCSSWVPLTFTDILPQDAKYWHAFDASEQLLVVLALYESPVRFGNYKELNDTLYKFLIAQWDHDRQALFFYSNDYKWFRVDELAKKMCGDMCEPFSGEQIFNIFNNLKLPLVKNLGTSQRGAISFTQYFGPNVTEGLSKIAQATSYISNLLALGYEDGEKTIWGCSQRRGKVWSVNSGSIADWSAWVKKVWDKACSGAVDVDNIATDFLKPERITQQHAEAAISVQWGEYIQARSEDYTTVIYGGKEVPLYFVDLHIEENDSTSYRITFSSEDDVSCYKFTIDGRLSHGYEYVHLSGPKLFIKRGAKPSLPAEEYFDTDPLILQYVNGDFSLNCFLIKVPQFIGEYNKDSIEVLDWSGVDIRKESMGKECATNSIQWKVFEEIKDEYDIVINDDGAGEAADLVAIKVRDGKIYLHLVHCKFSSSDTAGARIQDLYELCGQAQKSIRWKHSKFTTLYTHIKQRNQKWSPLSRFLKGDMPALSVVKNRARVTPIVLEVSVVQPGLSKSKVSSNMLKILGTTEHYLSETANASLRVIGED